MRCRTRQFLFVVLLAGFGLWREAHFSPLDKAEANFVTWLDVNTQRHPAAAPLALVQITDDDLHDTPWPWSPLEYSLFLNSALSFQPPVVAIEPILSWKKPDEQMLSLLHNQLLRAPKVVLGSQLGFPEDPSIIPPLQEVPVLRHVAGDITTLMDFTLVVHQPDESLRLSANLGFENQFTDAEMIRRVPLVFRYRGQVVPSFVLQSIMLWEEITPDDVIVAPGSAILLGKKLRIPIDNQGGMAVDFSIPFTRFQMSDLILAAEQVQAGKKPSIPAWSLKHQMALLARTDKASRTLHFADGRVGSLGELFASAIATAQTAGFIKRAPAWLEALLVLEGLILAWFCTRIRKLTAIGVCAVVYSVYMLIALGVFAGMGIAMPLILPSGLIAFILGFRLLD